MNKARHFSHYQLCRIFSTLTVFMTQSYFCFCRSKTFAIMVCFNIEMIFIWVGFFFVSFHFLFSAKNRVKGFCHYLVHPRSQVPSPKYVLQFTRYLYKYQGVVLASRLWIRGTSLLHVIRPVAQSTWYSRILLSGHRGGTSSCSTRTSNPRTS